MYNILPIKNTIPYSFNILKELLQTKKLTDYLLKLETYHLIYPTQFHDQIVKNDIILHNDSRIICGLDALLNKLIEKKKYISTSHILFLLLYIHNDLNKLDYFVDLIFNFNIEFEPSNSLFDYSFLLYLSYTSRPHIKNYLISCLYYARHADIIISILLNKLLTSNEDHFKLIEKYLHVEDFFNALIFTINQEIKPNQILKTLQTLSLSYDKLYNFFLIAIIVFHFPTISQSDLFKLENTVNNINVTHPMRTVKKIYTIIKDHQNIPDILKILYSISFELKDEAAFFLSSYILCDINQYEPFLQLPIHELLSIEDNVLNLNNEAERFLSSILNIQISCPNFMIPYLFIYNPENINKIYLTIKTSAFKTFILPYALLIFDYIKLQDDLIPPFIFYMELFLTHSETPSEFNPLIWLLPFCFPNQQFLTMKVTNDNKCFLSLMIFIFKHISLTNELPKPHSKALHYVFMDEMLLKDQFFDTFNINTFSKSYINYSKKFGYSFLIIPMLFPEGFSKISCSNTTKISEFKKLLNSKLHIVYPVFIKSFLTNFDIHLGYNIFLKNQNFYVWIHTMIIIKILNITTLNEALPYLKFISQYNNNKPFNPIIFFLLYYKISDPIFTMRYNSLNEMFWGLGLINFFTGMTHDIDAYRTKFKNSFLKTFTTYSDETIYNWLGSYINLYKLNKKLLENKNFSSVPFVLQNYNAYNLISFSEFYNIESLKSDNEEYNSFLNSIQSKQLIAPLCIELNQNLCDKHLSEKFYFQLKNHKLRDFIWPYLIILMIYKTDNHYDNLINQIEILYNAAEINHINHPLIWFLTYYESCDQFFTIKITNDNYLFFYKLFFIFEYKKSQLNSEEINDFKDKFFPLLFQNIQTITSIQDLNQKIYQEISSETEQNICELHLIKQNKLFYSKTSYLDLFKILFDKLHIQDKTSFHYFIYSICHMEIIIPNFINFINIKYPTELPKTIFTILTKLYLTQIKHLWLFTTLYAIFNRISSIEEIKNYIKLLIELKIPDETHPIFWYTIKEKFTKEQLLQIRNIDFTILYSGLIILYDINRKYNLEVLLLKLLNANNDIKIKEKLNYDNLYEFNDILQYNTEILQNMHHFSDTKKFNLRKISFKEILTKLPKNHALNEFLLKVPDSLICFEAPVYDIELIQNIYKLTRDPVVFQYAVFCHTSAVENLAQFVENISTEYNNTSKTLNAIFLPNLFFAALNIKLNRKINEKNFNTFALYLFVLFEKLHNKPQNTHKSLIQIISNIFLNVLSTTDDDFLYQRYGAMKLDNIESLNNFIEKYKNDYSNIVYYKFHSKYKIYLPNTWQIPTIEDYENKVNLYTSIITNYKKITDKAGIDKYKKLCSTLLFGDTSFMPILLLACFLPITNSIFKNPSLSKNFYAYYAINLYQKNNVNLTEYLQYDSYLIDQTFGEYSNINDINNGLLKKINLTPLSLQNEFAKFKTECYKVSISIPTHLFYFLIFYTNETIQLEIYKFLKAPKPIKKNIDIFLYSYVIHSLLLYCDSENLENIVKEVSELYSLSDNPFTFYLLVQNSINTIKSILHMYNDLEIEKKAILGIHNFISLMKTQELKNNFNKAEKSKMQVSGIQILNTIIVQQEILFTEYMSEKMQYFAKNKKMFLPKMFLQTQLNTKLFLDILNLAQKNYSSWTDEKLVIIIQYAYHILNYTGFTNDINNCLKILTDIYTKQITFDISKQNIISAPLLIIGYFCHHIDEFQMLKLDSLDKCFSLSLFVLPILKIHSKPQYLNFTIKKINEYIETCNEKINEKNFIEKITDIEYHDHAKYYSLESEEITNSYEKNTMYDIFLDEKDIECKEELHEIDRHIKDPVIVSSQFSYFIYFSPKDTNLIIPEKFKNDADKKIIIPYFIKQDSYDTTLTDTITTLTDNYILWVYTLLTISYKLSSTSKTKLQLTPYISQEILKILTPLLHNVPNEILMPSIFYKTIFPSESFTNNDFNKNTSEMEYARNLILLQNGQISISDSLKNLNFVKFEEEKINLNSLNNYLNKNIHFVYFCSTELPFSTFKKLDSYKFIIPAFIKQNNYKATLAESLVKNHDDLQTAFYLFLISSYQEITQDTTNLIVKLIKKYSTIQTFLPNVFLSLFKITDLYKSNFTLGYAHELLALCKKLTSIEETEMRIKLSINMKETSWNILDLQNLNFQEYLNQYTFTHSSINDLKYTCPEFTSINDVKIFLPIFILVPQYDATLLNKVSFMSNKFAMFAAFLILSYQASNNLALLNETVLKEIDTLFLDKYLNNTNLHNIFLILFDIKISSLIVKNNFDLNYAIELLLLHKNLTSKDQTLLRIINGKPLGELSSSSILDNTSLLNYIDQYQPTDDKFVYFSTINFNIPDFTILPYVNFIVPKFMICNSYDAKLLEFLKTQIDDPQTLFYAFFIKSYNSEANLNSIQNFMSIYTKSIKIFLPTVLLYALDCHPSLNTPPTMAAIELILLSEKKTLPRETEKRLIVCNKVEKIKALSKLNQVVYFKNWSLYLNLFISQQDDFCYFTPQDFKFTDFKFTTIQNQPFYIPKFILTNSYSFSLLTSINIENEQTLFYYFLILSYASNLILQDIKKYGKFNLYIQNKKSQFIDFMKKYSSIESFLPQAFLFFFQPKDSDSSDKSICAIKLISCYNSIGDIISQSFKSTNIKEIYKPTTPFCEFSIDDLQLNIKNSNQKFIIPSFVITNKYNKKIWNKLNIDNISLKFYTFLILSYMKNFNSIYQKQIENLFNMTDNKDFMPNLFLVIFLHNKLSTGSLNINPSISISPLIKAEKMIPIAVKLYQLANNEISPEEAYSHIFYTQYTHFTSLNDLNAIILDSKKYAELQDKNYSFINKFVQKIFSTLDTALDKADQSNYTFYEFNPQHNLITKMKSILYFLIPIYKSLKPVLILEVYYEKPLAQYYLNLHQAFAAALRNKNCDMKLYKKFYLAIHNKLHVDINDENQKDLISWQLLSKSIDNYPNSMTFFILENERHKLELEFCKLFLEYNEI